MIIHCAKSLCFICSIFACVSGICYKNRRVWDGVNIEREMNKSLWNPLHWEKGRIKHTQMKEKQCNFIV